MTELNNAHAACLENIGTKAAPLWLKRKFDKSALVAEKEGWPCGCLQTSPEGTGFIPGNVTVSALHVNCRYFHSHNAADLASNPCLQLTHSQMLQMLQALLWQHCSPALYFTQFCGSSQGADAAELQSVRSKAAEAIVDFVRFPDQYQFDLLEADAVVQLQNDPEFSALYQLLSTMLRSASIKVWLYKAILH